MKKVWLIIAVLSISNKMIADAASPTDQLFELRKTDKTVFTSQDEGCVSFVKDANGKEIIQLQGKPGAPVCGWARFQKIYKTDASSPLGWAGHVKLVNTNNPKGVFYLTGINPNRELNFNEKQQIACFVCKGPTNCNPNNPASSSECFDSKNSNYIDCSEQIDCSKVVEINECYKETLVQDVLGPTFYYNDLLMCPSFPTGLANYSGAGADAYNNQAAVTSIK